MESSNDIIQDQNGNIIKQGDMGWLARDGYTLKLQRARVEFISPLYDIGVYKFQKNRRRITFRPVNSNLSSTKKWNNRCTVQVNDYMNNNEMIRFIKDDRVIDPDLKKKEDEME
jgi:hypothetical protein